MRCSDSYGRGTLLKLITKLIIISVGWIRHNIYWLPNVSYPPTALAVLGSVKKIHGRNSIMAIVRKLFSVVKNTGSAILFSLLMLPTRIYCTGVAGGEAHVNISESGEDAKAGMLTGVNVVCGTISVAGILMIVSGIYVYFQGKQSDETRELMKAREGCRISCGTISCKIYF